MSRPVVIFYDPDFPISSYQLEVADRAKLDSARSGFVGADSLAESA